MSSKSSKLSKAERLLETTLVGSVTQPPVASPVVPRAPSAPQGDPRTKFEFSTYKAHNDQLSELSLFVAGQGRQVNRLRLIRSAILAAQKDPAFLAIYDEQTEFDKQRIRRE
jgi:hypothetical protein